VSDAAQPPSAPNGSGLWSRLRTILQEEAAELRPRQHALSAVSKMLPRHVGSGVRASLLRLRGVTVGEGTLVHDTPLLTGGTADSIRKLSIGKDCVIDIGCAFELGDELTIGDRVTIGHQVMIITTTHELGTREHRAGALVRQPVRIGDGALIGPRSVVLPGVVIGEGAIVDAGSVVNKSVAPHTRVRGIPARQVEELTP